MSDVTVVIPYWDLDPAILQECIDSVRYQSEQCEILIVDNVSSVAVAEQPGVNVLRLEERVSVGEARNIGLRAVETKFMMFMDADDVLLPDAIRILRSLLESHPEASIAAGRIVDWHAQTGRRQPKAWPSRTAHALSMWPAAFRVVNTARNMTPVTGCAVMHTDKAKTCAGFPDTTGEDWIFGASMNFRGSLVLSEQYVKLYRSRDNSLSQIAVEDWSALYEARRASRRNMLRDPFVPLWLKMTWPLMTLFQTLEVPFHVRREKAFARRARAVLRTPVTTLPRRTAAVTAAVGPNSDLIPRIRAKALAAEEKALPPVTTRSIPS